MLRAVLAVGSCAAVLGLTGLTTSAPAMASVDGTGATRLVTVADPRISESSGLVASPTHDHLVWTVNDSGHTASVFGVSLRTGRTVAVLRLRDTDARDWESMAAQRLPDGTGALWIGDTGDNRRTRDSVVLRLVREPETLPSGDGTITVDPVSLRVRYPDGPHDVEALVATPDGRLLLVSKDLFSGTVYEVPPAAVATALAGRSVTTAVTVRSLGGVRQSLVTDGVARSDGRVVLRGYVDAVVYADRTRAGRGLEPLRRVGLPGQEQGETIAVIEAGAALLVGSEGVRQPLWRVPLDSAATATLSPGVEGGPATATADASTSTPPDDVRPAAARVPGEAGHEVLVWVLRVVALLLIPVALGLGLRRRR